MMGKEHFIETFGVPIYTLSTGGSGGAITSEGVGDGPAAERNAEGREQGRRQNQEDGHREKAIQLVEQYSWYGVLNHLRHVFGGGAKMCIGEPFARMPQQGRCLAEEEIHRLLGQALCPARERAAVRRFR